MKNRLIIFILIIFIGINLRAYGETITYNLSIKQAIDSSYDIKMAKLDIDISKADLKAAKADLYPTIYAQFNTEYNNGLGNQANINYVGNTVVSSYTQYRDLAMLGLQYNLFDFGATKKKVLISKKDVEEKKVSVDLQVKDLKLKVLDAYTNALKYSDEIKTKNDILKVYQEMFEAKERLFKAGTKDKISVMDEAVKIARTQDDIENSKLELKKSLVDLASYTLQKYNTDNIEILDFDEMNIENNIKPISSFQPLQAKVAEDEDSDFSFDPEQSLEAKYYNFEIEKKKAELDMYKKQRYPSFKFYTNYLLYGQNPNNYFSSYSDFKQASLSFGISGYFAIFDGFKNKASKEKAALEIQKLQLEKAQKLTELKTDYNKSLVSYVAYKNRLAVKKTLLFKVRDKKNAVDRMFKNGFIDKTELLTSKADLLDQENELQKNIIELSAEIKKIEIIAGRNT